MYQVIDCEQDVAGKWRIRVDIAGQTVMFKYDEQPNNEVLQEEVARYETRVQQATLDAERAARIEALVQEMIAQEQADGAPNPK